jgi:isoleucyl-tRNA synthetase
MSDKKKGYRDTLNLPSTSFGMKANLVQKEPQQRKAWDKEDIYGRILEARKDAPTYVLHDGPPYANGDIHMGHVINKVLKDIVVKYKTMTGFWSPYVPGWDCHGLPIEVKVMAELGGRCKEMSKPEIRKHCQKYASKYVKVQTKQFKSLGIFGDFKNPYLTLKPQYEKGILEIFAELVGNGLVYKQLKPIHWSVGCETALADAELEYKDISGPSIYVNFELEAESADKLRELGLVEDGGRVCFMIWTTTPWTLAANLAVAVHPRLEYVGLTYEKDGTKYTSIVVSERLEAVIEAAGLEDGTYAISKLVKGKELEGLRYRHPFVEKNPTDKDAYYTICADFVTTEDGTGIVHIAPGHGVEDYIAGQQYGLSVYSPVKDDGCYDNTVPEWLAGKNVLQVDKDVNEHLRKIGLLVHEEQMVHSYPHCWRSKMPVIFRATEQWFVSVDKDLPGTEKSLRNMALEQIEDVKWVPGWGQKRIQGMLESRPDWCISRQRSWGLPIPAFVNSKGKSLLTKESVLAVAEYIGNKGSDSWFTDSPKEILGEGFELPEGFNWDDLEKEENIFDVWFESGCSWYSVAHYAGWEIPVDLYLEGSDQHRGWFQLSLLPALGSIRKAPFKTVLTHGFTVDEKGMKQSKSAGNYVSALEEIEKYGADILRLWVASVNYQEDMRCSDELIGRLQDAYRKIRNTLRYLLGNIDDFEPDSMSVDYNEMLKIDQWAMEQYVKLVEKVHDAYESFGLHRMFSLIYNFCTVEMSSIYMDVLKDRLYCDEKNSLSRRSAQTVMQNILDGLVRMLAPILVHTTEEAWGAMKHKSQEVESVHLATMPKADGQTEWKENEGRWEKIMKLRDDVLRILEGLRQAQEIASNQEASVEIISDDETVSLVEDFGAADFAALCIVSEVKIGKGPESKITAAKSSHAKCERCWNYWPSVGTDSTYGDLCERCANVVRSLQA